MQNHEFKNTTEPIEVEVVFHSLFYTVARATATVSNGNGGRSHKVHAEGVSVKCWKDKEDDPELGAHIAMGRARKALALKLRGRMRREHIRRATDLLMNG